MSDDLPPEVLAQLSKRRAGDDLADQILGLFGSTALGIDEVIIAMWRSHKIVLRRKFVMSKLYRMMMAGTLSPVPGERGRYTRAVSA